MKPFTGIILTLGLFLTGCATIPSAVRETPPGDLQLGEVRDNVNTHRDTLVRWGGTILGVENKDNETWITVSELKLDGSGRPKSNSPSAGRFLIRESGFHDPAIYAKGREITAVGVLADEVKSSDGNQPYSLPVIEASEHKLWEPYRRYSYYRNSYRYGYYPYYRHGFRYGHGYYPHYGFRSRFHH